MSQKNSNSLQNCLISQEAPLCVRRPQSGARSLLSLKAPYCLRRSQGPAEALGEPQDVPGVSEGSEMSQDTSHYLKRPQNVPGDFMVSYKALESLRKSPGESEHLRISQRSPGCLRTR